MIFIIVYRAGLKNNLLVRSRYSCTTQASSFLFIHPCISCSDHLWYALRNTHRLNKKYSLLLPAVVRTASPKLTQNPIFETSFSNFKYFQNNLQRIFKNLYDSDDWNRVAHFHKRTWPIETGPLLHASAPKGPVCGQYS